MAGLNTRLIEQINDVLRDYAALMGRSSHDDLSSLPEADIARFNTRALATVLRTAGPRSAYAEQSDRAIKTGAYSGHIARSLAGILEALRSDLEKGYVESMRELLHGELFADFLEMAQHLLEEGYKDAAAVIAGSSLEAHLRQLCEKHGISVDQPSQESTKPKKADTLNSELASAEVYSKLDQKNVTAWLDLRNKAAHGKYAEYVKGQVALLIAGIRDFMTRNPA